MAGKNIMVVDDYPNYARNVLETIKNYYESSKCYDFNIIVFTGDQHFNKASEHINNQKCQIDMIFSDQELANKLGTDLFKLTQMRIGSRFQSITSYRTPYKVMHSTQNERLKEYLKEYSKVCNHFVNSGSKKDINECLDFYEQNILPVKTNGNTNFLRHLYEKPDTREIYTRTQINIDGFVVKLSDIFFMVLDQDDLKGEKYLFCFKTEEEVRFSIRSKKPPYFFNSNITDASFITAYLVNDSNQLCKINPLWVFSPKITTNTDLIKLRTPFGTGFEITCTNVKFNLKINFLDNIDDFFQ